MDLHAAAERSGIVAALLKGQVSRSGYALYLRNLLPVYESMEDALRCHRDQPDFAGLAQPALHRAACIIADLLDLVGTGWAASLPLLPSGRNYAARVAWAGHGPPLIAHCYTRYLGDLNGGQLLGQRLTRRFGTGFQALAFGRFPAITDLAAFQTAYRQALDHAADRLPDIEAVVEEAAVAFEMNIHLSVEVDAFDRESAD